MICVSGIRVRKSSKYYANRNTDYAITRAIPTLFLGQTGRPKGYACGKG